MATTTRQLTMRVPDGLRARGEAIKSARGVTGLSQIFLEALNIGLAAIEKYMGMSAQVPPEGEGVRK